MDVEQLIRVFSEIKKKFASIDYDLNLYGKRMARLEKMDDLLKLMDKRLSGLEHIVLNTNEDMMKICANFTVFGDNWEDNSEEKQD